MQVLRLQEHRRSLKDDEIPMIDHVEDTIVEEDEEESDFVEPSIVEGESLTLPSIVITPSLNQEEDICKEDNSSFMKPPLAEPESLALPSVVSIPNWKKDENLFEEQKIDEKHVKFVLENRNQRIVAMLFRSLPFCSDTTVIE